MVLPLGSSSATTYEALSESCMALALGEVAQCHAGASEDGGETPPGRVGRTSHG